jgi:predicted component of type VI protein secretion system
MMRDKIGGYATRNDIDAFLNRWIQTYIALRERARGHQGVEAALRSAYRCG